jgi:hypothetical protein
VLAARWSMYVPSSDFNSHMEETVRKLIEAKLNVYVLREVPFPGEFDAPRTAAVYLMRHGNMEELGVARYTYEQRQKGLEGTFSHLAQAGAVILDPSPYFLNQKGIFNVVQNGVLLYGDTSHLTVEGAKLLTPLFAPIFAAK